MKTKEEILGPPFIEVYTRQEVLKAMDAHAAQVLEEYKRKLLLETSNTVLLNEAAKYHVHNLIDRS